MSWLVIIYPKFETFYFVKKLRNGFSGSAFNPAHDDCSQGLGIKAESLWLLSVGTL